MRLPQADESFEGQQKTPVARWGRFVTSHAPLVFAVSLVLALLLAAPALKVRLGAADAGTAPKSNTTRQAYDILSDKKDGFGPGFTSPITVVVKGDKAQANKVYNALKGITGTKGDIVFVSPPFANKAGDVSIINAYSKFSPQDAKTDDLVSLLRKKIVPSTGVTAYVTGQNAAFTDIGNQILRRLPWFLLFIIGVTVVLLTMAFRSLVIAIKAALTTLLSAFVGFGVLVGVVQLGHGMGILGLDRTGPIESFVPPIAFAILFGLSMDYEVFLMSRVREEHVRGKAMRQALVDGIAGVGRVIVAAALIMSSVFFSFTIGDDRITKEFGLLLGIAILCDALLVRMTMVPALLTMLGERSWLIPRWLDKALPNLTVEPPGTIEHDLPAPRRDPTPEPEPA
jgi:RND superfamily putative drug exporter